MKKRAAWFVLTAVTCGVACGQGERRAAPAAVSPCEGMNVLTDAEKAAGWKLLFDGKSKSGWHGYNGQSVESWTVAGAFGQRRFVSVTMLLVIGLAAVREALPRRAPRIAWAGRRTKTRMRESGRALMRKTGRAGGAGGFARRRRRIFLRVR